MTSKLGYNLVFANIENDWKEVTFEEFKSAVSEKDFEDVMNCFSEKNGDENEVLEVKSSIGTIAVLYRVPGMFLNTEEQLNAMSEQELIEYRDLLKVAIANDEGTEEDFKVYTQIIEKLASLNR